MSIDILKKINATNLNGEKINIYNNNDLTTQYLYGTLKSINDTSGSITKLRDYAFTGCSYLETAYLSGITALNFAEFYSCSNLKIVTLPNASVINQYVFDFCVNLLTVEAPLCESVGYSAFFSCRNLMSVTFSQNLSMIGTSAFAGCSKLKSNGFPTQNIQTLNSYCFSGCTNLTSLSFPKCTTIGSGAFQYCSALSALILTSTSITRLASSNALKYTPMDASSYLGYWGSIYVPESLVENYKVSTNWTVYSNRITSLENLPQGEQNE